MGNTTMSRAYYQAKFWIEDNPQEQSMNAIGILLEHRKQFRKNMKLVMALDDQILVKETTITKKTLTKKKTVKEVTY